MNYMFSFVCISIALIYFNRARSLTYKHNETIFVSMNLASGSVCILCAYYLWEFGISPLALAAPIPTIFYLIRSRETFVNAKEISEPMELDTSDYPRVWGRGR